MLLLRTVYIVSVTIHFGKMKRGIFVAGLREEIVASPDQVLELMEFGECKFLHFIF